MTQQSTKRERPASTHDYAEELRAELPRATKGYVLARFALAHKAYDRSDTTSYAYHAGKALCELRDAHEVGELQPPLHPDVYEEIVGFLEDVEERGRGISGSASALILSMALEQRGEVDG